MCFPSETKHVNAEIYNMITRINETKTLAKHITYDSKF